MAKTLGQKRAGDAYAKVRQVASTYSEQFEKEYSSYAKSLPALILGNGLGQATAFLMSAAKGREDDAHMVLYRHLEGWLCRGDDDCAPYPGESDLIKAITGKERNQYIYAQAEALEWLSWLKKFAVALLKQPDGGDQ